MDDERLRFIPYMGDAEGSKKKNARLIHELEQAYSPKPSTSSRESEWSSQVRACLEVSLEKLGLGIGQDKLIQYLLDQGRNRSRDSEIEKRTIHESFELPLEPRERELAKMASQAFRKVYDRPLEDILLSEEHLKELAERTNSNQDKPGRTPTKSQLSQTDINKMESSAESCPDRLGTYTTLICLICGAASCQTHGDSARDENAPGYQYVHQPLVTTYQDILRKQDARIAAKAGQPDFSTQVDTPCSSECYLVSRYDDSAYKLPAEDISTIESMVISLRDKKRRACTIAFFMDLPCWKVHSEIKHMEPRSVELPSKNRARQPDWYNNQKKTLKWDWQDMTTAHLHQERCQANPVSYLYYNSSLAMPF